MSQDEHIFIFEITATPQKVGGKPKPPRGDNHDSPDKDVQVGAVKRHPHT